MCLLTDSIGTPEELDTDGKILVIEDVDEQPHRIDAMFTHLVNSGLAAKSAGFVIGQMTRTDEHVDEAIGGRPWRDIITERLAPLGKPMIFDFPFGHMKGMLTIALGLMARLDADAGTLTFLEPLCE
jgi:muramoyltetrapeptide carboxypeptidase